MKVLLVTAKLAAEKVKKIAAKHGCKVYVAPADIASLVTTQMVKEITETRGIGLILVPGLMRGDLFNIEDALKVPTFRGPKDVADLDYVLENIGKFKLSKTVSACEILAARLKERALREIRKVDAKKYRDTLVKRRGNLLVGDLGVGWDFPQRVVAEISGIEGLAKDEVLHRARYLSNSGADVIDLGIGEINPKIVKETIKALRPIRVPISIDTMETENIESALENGVDMVMSFDGDLVREFKNVKVPSVIIPKRGKIPSSPTDRVHLLEKNIKFARKRGFKKIIADPILMPPPGLVDSIAAYKEFSHRNPHKFPILLGAGNVTESFDADSVGMNALLSAIGSECNTSLLFTVEASDKTKGSAGELQIAAKMMYLSKIRGSPPKDLGLDLLRLKEKRLKRETLGVDLQTKEITAEAKKQFRQDLMGYLKIFVEEDCIRCVHYHKGGAGVSIVGKNATEMSDTILSMGLVSNLEHALYIGRELQRAEFALEYGKSYVQD